MLSFVEVSPWFCKILRLRLVDMSRVPRLLKVKSIKVLHRQTSQCHSPVNTIICLGNTLAYLHTLSPHRMHVIMSMLDLFKQLISTMLEHRLECSECDDKKVSMFPGLSSLMYWMSLIVNHLTKAHVLRFNIYLDKQSTRIVWLGVCTSDTLSPPIAVDSRDQHTFSSQIK